MRKASLVPLLGACVLAVPLMYGCSSVRHEPNPENTILSRSAIRSTASIPTIPLVVIDTHVGFFEQMIDAARQEAKRLHVKLEVYDPNDNPIDQEHALRDYVTQHVAAIVVDAVDAKGIVPTLEYIHSHHIPVVTVDNTVVGKYVSAWIGVNNFDAGRKIGLYTVNYINKYMDGKANIGIIGNLKSPVQIARQNGFESALKGHPGIRVVQVVDGTFSQDTANQAAQNLITANPEMNMIMSTNESNTTAAVAAVVSRGLQGKIKITGFEPNQGVAKYVSSGLIIGAIETYPAGEGKLGIDFAVDAIKGKPITHKKNYTKVFIVNKGNISYWKTRLY